eukprot:jgi/Antlo1/636/2491
MNYKVMEFTLEYRIPEKSYFVDRRRGKESMTKQALDILFMGRQKRSSFVAFCTMQNETHAPVAKHVTTCMEYSRPCFVFPPCGKYCKDQRRKPLQFFKEVDNFFTFSRKRTLETSPTFISKKPLANVDPKMNTPTVTVFREARPHIAGTLFPIALSSSSSYDGDSDITIEINMNNMHGFERDILKLGEFYSISETSESGSWILNINRLVSLSTKKCNAFKKNVIFRPEAYKSLSDERLFIAVQNIVKKHFSAH